MQFFRPIDAPYEAAELYAYANVFVGAVTPVAFVGSVNCEFINNTIYRPEKWALRILQETVDTTRFLPCSDNTFSNNIVYLDERVTTACNIGPNTAPETFTMSNNLWLNIDEPFWGGPELPVTDPNIIIQVDPLFMDPDNDNFDIEVFSPAIGSGLDVPQPVNDYLDRPFNTPRSIGAFEGNVVVSVKDQPVAAALQIYPNPVKDYLSFSLEQENTSLSSLQLFTMEGTFITSLSFIITAPALYTVRIPAIPSGNYLLSAFCKDGSSWSARLQKI